MDPIKRGPYRRRGPIERSQVPRLGRPRNGRGVEVDAGELGAVASVATWRLSRRRRRVEVRERGAASATTSSGPRIPGPTRLRSCSCPAGPVYEWIVTG